ncbi:DUF917 domain-containing protein [Brevibacillus nitrificans]|uniref:DUF917 domain-containing protein n=1 Tax=Brevibacillus nitrificans TaxID=651560 RepID=UPI002618FF22|nr:DUF917 domain-containing protein [Brevibacillus nitrificans]
MRLLGKQEIEDIAKGSTLLGAGGGGDPHIGMLMAIQAVEEYGPIQLLTVDEVPDDAFVVSSAGFGAPTIFVEKPFGGLETKHAMTVLEQHMGKEVFATFPIEAGGANSMLPLVTAAQLGLPVVDVDGMGRAFPLLQLTSFYLDGLTATPMVLADEQANTTLIDTVDTPWAERIARSVTIQLGGAAGCAVYPMTGKNLKESGILNVLTYAEEIGRAARLAKEANVDPVQEVLKVANGFELFRGKVVDVDRRTDDGWAKGAVKIEGLFGYQGQQMELRVQNENMLAKVDNRLVCVTPDLISVIDAETGVAITTEGVRYGMRVVVVGIPCHPKWRTAKGLEISGPDYFGYDVAYTPVEELMKGRDLK